MINPQAWSIMRIYRDTPESTLLSKAGLVLVCNLLTFYQRLYAYKLISLPDVNSSKEILLSNLKMRDKTFQLGELPNDTLI